jgi:hypothetical protein
LSIVAHRIFDLTSRTKNTICYIITFRDREITYFDIDLPDLTATLPVLGTIGLILIVLGSLELELNKSKIGLIKKSSIGAFLPLIVLAFPCLFVAILWRIFF